MKTIDLTALVLTIVGGLNWGLVGAFEYNLVDELFGEGSGLSRAIYVLVGLSALWVMASVFPRIVNNGNHNVAA